MVSPADNSNSITGGNSRHNNTTISSISISRYLFGLLLLVSLAFNLYYGGAGYYWWGGRHHYHYRPNHNSGGIDDDVALLDPAIWLGDLQTSAAAANKNQTKKSKTPNVSSKKKRPPPPPLPSSKDVVSSSELTAAAAAAAPVVFFDRQDDTSTTADDDDIKCTISNSSISEMKYVGCGFSGQVFAVRMDCDEPVVDGRSAAARPTTSINSRRKQTHQTIAVKLLTVPANKTDKKKIVRGRIGIYTSERDDKQHKFMELYQRLISPTTTTTTTTAEDEKDKALRHFSIRLGSVSLSRSMVENTIDLVNPLLRKHHPYKGMVLDPDNTDGFVDGYLYSTTRDSKPLASFGLGGRFREEGRHQEAVRDIIYIYWHSYRRGVIHCDMKLDHLMYSASTNTTFMIDFDSYRLTPLPPGIRRDLQWQQWQCFSVIANICDRPAQQKQQKDNEVLLPSHMACNNKKSMKGLNPRETYATIFENCGFDRPMVWSDKMLKHTEETYQALADWSGMSRRPV